MTAVVGIGNLIHSDDGIGVHAIQRLMTDPRMPSDVVLMDGGTQGLSLLPHVSGFDRLLVIDAIDVGETPGTLIRLEGKACEGLHGKPSVHQLGFADMMIAMRLLGDKVPEVVVLGVQPLSTEWSDQLTPLVEAALNHLPELVLAQLEAWAATPCG